MRDFLLDTQTVRYWYDGNCTQHAAVIGNIESLKEQARPPEHKPRLLVSVLTLGEIEFGHRVQAADFAEKQEAYIRFVGQQLPDRLEHLTVKCIVSAASEVGAAFVCIDRA